MQSIIQKGLSFNSRKQSDRPERDDEKQCSLSPECMKLMTAADHTTYMATHQLLFTIFAQSVSTPDETDSVRFF